MTENLQGLFVNVITKEDWVSIFKEAKKHDEYLKIWILI